MVFQKNSDNPVLLYSVFLARVEYFYFTKFHKNLSCHHYTIYIVNIILF